MLTCPAIAGGGYLLRQNGFAWLAKGRGVCAQLCAYFILLTCLCACVAGGELGSIRRDWCQICQGAGERVRENIDHIHSDAPYQFALAYPFACCEQASRSAKCLCQVATEPVSKQVGVGRGLEGNVPSVSRLVNLAQRRCEWASDLVLYRGKQSPGTYSFPQPHKPTLHGNPRGSGGGKQSLDPRCCCIARKATILKRVISLVKGASPEPPHVENSEPEISASSHGHPRWCCGGLNWDSHPSLCDVWGGSGSSGGQGGQEYVMNNICSLTDACFTRRSASTILDPGDIVEAHMESLGTSTNSGPAQQREPPGHTDADGHYQDSGVSFEVPGSRAATRAAAAAARSSAQRHNAFRWRKRDGVRQRRVRMQPSSGHYSRPLHPVFGTGT